MFFLQQGELIDDFIGFYEEIDQWELLRNVEDHIGEFVIVNGTVSNKINNESFLLSIDGKYDHFFIGTKGDITELREGDFIAVYGVLMGDICFTDSIGMEICIPSLELTFYKK